MEFKEGDRVVRGPNWQWHDQDGGAGNPGTVEIRAAQDVMIGGYAWVNVRWDRGGLNGYRIGPDVCDLKLLDPVYGNEED